ncbi:MAG TPA: hypothetical protein VE990_08810 [Acidimicrobiales bacterium]|nr:hypothetical protein [Acidimicrobiales bacterium]
MIRFAWLQARTQTVVLGTGVALVAILAAIMGPHLGHLYAAAVGACRANHDCVGRLNPFSDNDYALYGALGALVVVLPGLAACSGGRLWSPASWRRGPTAWPGPRAWGGGGGWRPGWPWSAWPAWLRPAS